MQSMCNLSRNFSAIEIQGRLVEPFIHLYYYILYFLISAATGAATPDCIGTVIAADKVGLLGFHNAVCVVRGSFLFT